MVLNKTILIKKLLGKTIPVVLPVFLVSCGSFNFVKSPAEQPEVSQSNDKVNSNAFNPVNSNANPQNNHLAIQALESEVFQLKLSLEEIKVQVAQENQTIQNLQKKTRLFENKITDLVNKKNTSGKRSQKIKYKTPENLYKRARQLLLEESYTEAADHFSTFINDQQNHPLSDNAVYWLAECHYSQENFQQAIFVFKNLVKKYPKSEKVPDALLKTGYSYLSLDDSNRAHHYLKQVLKKYPFSQAAETAQTKLGEFD